MFTGFRSGLGDVCRLLLGNVRHYIEEFHADGFRYDEVSILLSTKQENGWEFRRALTTQLETSNYLAV